MQDLKFFNLALHMFHEEGKAVRKDLKYTVIALVRNSERKHNVFVYKKTPQGPFNFSFGDTIHQHHSQNLSVFRLHKDCFEYIFGHFPTVSRSSKSAWK